MKREKKKKAPCVMKLMIGGQELEFLYDLGSAANLIKKSKVSEEVLSKLKVSKATLRGITNNKLPCSGVVKLPYELDGEIIYGKTYIIEDEHLQISEDGVISRKLVYKNKMLLRGRNDRVKFRGKMYKLHLSKPSYSVQRVENEIKRGEIKPDIPKWRQNTAKSVAVQFLRVGAADTYLHQQRGSTSPEF